MKMRDQLLEKVNESDELPSFPDVILRLEQMIREDKAGNQQIAKLVSTDISIAGKILKMANSSFYGSTGRGEITNLTVAISRLGHKVIREIIFSVALSKLFADSAITDPKLYWRHCLAVATFSHAISRRVGASIEDQDISYMTGLMHDVGIMVFGEIIPKEYLEFLIKIVDKDQSLEYMETYHFGIDHAELGAAFIEKWWPVDPEIINGVRNHHNPNIGDIKERRPSQLVNVANGICNYAGMGNGINVFKGIFQESSWSGLGLELEDVEVIMDEVREAISHAESLLKAG